MGCGASSSTNAIVAYAPNDAGTTYAHDDTHRIDLVCASATDIGGPQKKENQDVYLWHPKLGGVPSCHLFGVMDGHGQHGLKTARFCAQTLPTIVEAIYDSSRDPTSMASVLRRAFEETHGRVSNRARSRCDAKASGTTATVGLLDGLQLVLGWVGDSQALMVQRDPSGELKGSWISRCHQFTEEDEKRRVLDCGGWVDQSRASGSPNGPLRCYVKGQGYPGLMVSRSLGDLDAHSIGVSAEPECFCKVLTPEDAYVVVCSDGVWDVLFPGLVLKIVQEYGADVDAAAKKIVSRARQEWSKQPRADNITAQVVMLQYVSLEPEAQGVEGMEGIVGTKSEDGETPRGNAADGVLDS